MGNTLYLDCASGISADMVVGALLDLGANEAGLRRALSSLKVDGYEVEVTRKQVGEQDACDFNVILDEAHDGHDHDMHYLYDDLDKDTAHHHIFVRDHHKGKKRRGLFRIKAKNVRRRNDDHHHHEHRSPADISAIIDAADLAPRAKAYAHRILDILTAAESKAHGVAPEDVHFHEVGAVDSIVDMISAAYCLDELDVDYGIISPLAEGTGRVRTAHGVLSVPVPAVANIVASEGLVLTQLQRTGEFVTPTGAAIAAAVRTADSLPERYRVRSVGVGSGKRAYNPPSTVRAMIIEPIEDSGEAQADDAEDGPSHLARRRAPELSRAASDNLTFNPRLWKLETEMDDCPGEALGRVLDRLFEVGAREAHYLPVYMKKNRPAWQVEVVCDEDVIPAIEQVLFEDTTTIGVRRYPLDRTALAREAVEVQTSLGTARAKCVTLPDGRVRSYPEFESVSELAARSGVPYQDVYQQVVGALAGA